MQLHSKIDNLMDNDFDDYTITFITTAIEQMWKKSDRIAQLDEKIVSLIDDADEFESAMYEAEEFQDDIVDKITTATRFMELSAAKSCQRSQTPPVATSLAEISQKVHTLTQM